MASLLDPIWRPLRDWYAGWAWGYGRAPQVLKPDEPSLPQPDAQGERTERQDSGVAGGAWGGWLTPKASPTTYRDMLRQPTLALVRGHVFGDILAGSWSVDADKGADEAAKKLIEDAILPHRTCILRHALTGLDFGMAGFEVVPKVANGTETIDYFKPLRHELTTILIQPHGEFAGLRNNQVDLYAAFGQCLLYTYDGDAGDLYGRARLENCRESVAKWYEVQTKIGLLMGKESGAVMKVAFPPGEGGTTTDANRSTAVTFAENVKSGSAYIVVMNALGALRPEQRRTATIDQIIELLKTDLWKAEKVDLDGNADAIKALQLYAAYLDAQIVRGYLRPERSVLEGTGDKTGVGVQSDTGTTDSERVDADIVESLNKQEVDYLLVQNYGERARGSVWLKANPLRDVQETIDTALITAAAGGAATADEFFRTYDFDAITERRGIPKRKTPLPAPVAPAPAGPPGVNGNGNGRMNGNGVALSRMMAGLFGEEHDG